MSEDADGQASLFGDARPLSHAERWLAERREREQGLTGRGDGATQRAAAAKVPGIGTKRGRVLDAIKAAGEAGVTDEEIGEATGMDYSHFGPRRRELVRDGWVRESGRTRRARTGADQVVWIAVDPPRVRA